jgi:hypothetical protein
MKILLIFVRTFLKHIYMYITFTAHEHLLRYDIDIYIDIYIHIYIYEHLLWEEHLFHVIFYSMHAF